MNNYIPSLKNDIKGIIYNRTKNKLQQHFVTQSYAQAVICLCALPYPFFDFDFENVPVLYELWENFCEDLYGNKNGYVYTVQVIDNLKSGENLNGGYKSQLPYRVIGCEEIVDVYSKIKELEQQENLKICRFSQLNEEQKTRLFAFAQRVVKRNNMSARDTEYTEILKEKMPELFNNTEEMI